MEFLKLYKEENRDILYSMSWLNKNSIFDKSIGSFKEIDLFTFLENVIEFDYNKDIFYDDIYYILEYTQDSITHLLNNINKEIKREHKIIPISQAKEFDKKTILWLSRQDGQTIKEKLKNNKIKAVKRYKNVDTYENRIFKIFLKKLVLIFEARKDIQNNDYILHKIRQWLRSEDAKNINEYGNTIYNNILLHHPHYNKIFKGYKWLNRLDKKVEKYLALYPKQIIDILTFSTLAKLQFKTEKLVLSDVLEIDYNNFEIKFNEKCLPEKISLLHNIANLKVKTIKEVNFNNVINLEKNIINKQLNLELYKDRTFKIDISGTDKIFIDLFRLFPIASINKKIINFPILLKQKVKNKIVNANNTKIINLNNEMYTLPEILKTYDTEILKYFLEDFKKSFEDCQLNYIIPDYVNIFEFSQVKKSINSYFPKSRNIPKSILAGLDLLLKGTIQENDTLIYIQKDHENNLYITPLLVKYDENLQSITNGLYLEKHPTRKFIEENNVLDELNKSLKNKELSQMLLSKFLQNGIKGIKQQQIALYLDKNIIYLKNINNLSKKKNRINQIKPLFRNKNLFKNKFIELRDKNEENLYNFEKLLKYEKNGFTLWKEHLPRLAMQLPMKGYFGEFVLVDENSEVANGNIKIENHFKIPANTKELSFPLIFSDENINFEAYITSNELPLKEDIECELELTYDYEAETPYKLTFISLDNSIKKLKVQWREIQYKKCDNLPIPIYPPKKSWSDFVNYKNQNDRTTNLIEWMENNFKKIIEFNDYYMGNSKKIIFLENICFNWFTDRKGDFASKIIIDGIGEVFFHQNNFQKFNKNINSVTFELQKSRMGGYQARNIIEGKELPYEMIISFRKSLRFPLYTIWKDGNSLSDMNIPNKFRILAQKAISSSVQILNNKESNTQLKNELFLFLCAIHKDAPNSIYDMLLKISKNKMKLKKYRNNIALSLSCVNTNKQKELFSAIIDLLNSQDEKVYSNVLKILGVAFWKCKYLILDITQEQFNLIVKKLVDSFKLKIKQNELFKGKTTKESVIIRLELLLALLRYRENMNVLCMENNGTKELIKIVDILSRMVIENKKIFKSRIQIGINKTNGFEATPDLLYALRIYLSGDSSSANSIQILGVSDD